MLSQNLVIKFYVPSFLKVYCFYLVQCITRDGKLCGFFGGHNIHCYLSVMKDSKHELCHCWLMIVLVILWLSVYCLYHLSIARCI